MKIGFEAKKIVRNLTGIGNYSRGVVEDLSLHYPSNDYILYAPTDTNTEAFQRLRPAKNILMKYPSGWFWRALNELWRCFGVIFQLRRDGIDIYHGLSNELPFGITHAGCKSIVTIHDMIFLRMPSTYSRMQRMILKLKTFYACKHADLIVAISECTKRDIMHYYHVPDNKIRVIYQGCNPMFRAKASDETIDMARQHYGLTKPYLLSVGTFEERKNQLQAVEAMRMIPSNIDLVLVGKSTDYQRVIERRVAELHIENRVHILHDVPQAYLPSLYQGCTAFLYLSKYEGFGIPVLEALCSKVPVVVAKGSCLEEVGGEAAFCTSPDNVEELACQLIHILRNPEEIKERVEKGLEHSKRFTPERMASDMMSVYNELLDLRTK